MRVAYLARAAERDGGPCKVDLAFWPEHGEGEARRRRLVRVRVGVRIGVRARVGVRARG